MPVPAKKRGGAVTLEGVGLTPWSALQKSAGKTGMSAGSDPFCHPFVGGCMND